MTHPPGPTNPWRNLRRAQQDTLAFLRQTRDQYGDLLYTKWVSASPQPSPRRWATIGAR